MAHQWITVHVDGQQMWAFTSLPDTPGPHPGVALIHHGYLDDWVQDMVQRVSEAGYAVVAPDLHHRVDPNVNEVMGRVRELRDYNIIKDVNATIELFRSHPAVLGDRIGIMGFCLGGRIAYIMAAVNSSLKAAAAFYPGNIMVARDDGPSPFDRTANIGCPVIGFFGQDDPNPNPDHMNKLDAELTRHGKVHEFHTYAGAGHSFQWNGNENYRAEASKDSWERLLAWFQKHLVVGSQ